jgi:hypothetical protein
MLNHKVLQMESQAFPSWNITYVPLISNAARLSTSPATRSVESAIHRQAQTPTPLHDIILTPPYTSQVM